MSEGAELVFVRQRCLLESQKELVLECANTTCLLESQRELL